MRGRPVGRDGAIAAATARAGRFALFSNEAVGPLEALAACHDKDAIEKRFGDARGLPGLRTPRVSAEGTLAGRPLVVFVALVPAAWLRRRTHVFWFNKNCAEIALIFGQRTHRFLRSIRIA